MPEREELTSEHVGDVNIEEKAQHDPVQKGNTEQAFINPPETDRMNNPVTNDGRHVRTSREYKPIPDGDVLRAQDKDHIDNKEKAVPDLNEKGNTKYVTTDTLLNDRMDNTATDDGRHELTSRAYKSMAIGEEVTTGDVDDVSINEMMVQDPN